MIEINLASETLFTIFGLNITNTLLTTFLVSLLIIVFGSFLSPKRHKNILSQGLEVLFYRFLQLTDTLTNNRELSKKILPTAITFFIFIITSNLIALIPGFLGSFYYRNGDKIIPILRSPNSDLNTTIALAISAVVTIQIVAMKELGLKKYIKKFFNFSSPIKFFQGFLELISEGTKILSFAFRLFGNIFAGEVLLIIIGFLVPYFIPLPFMILELFVGLIQALIFAMLTLTFSSSAIEID